MKSTILLTTALFLASAPSPDAKDISELSAGFLSVSNEYGLMASEDTLSGRFDPRTSVQLESIPATLTYKQKVLNADPAKNGIPASKESAEIN